ncbi:MAG: chemotaxis response regulator protein-glutamate methylesterase [Chryseotalea sp.]
MQANNNKTKVLIVDDSAVVRKSLTQILLADKSIEVIGTASDPYVAVKKIAEQVPDVITLDLEMPRMDGITFLQKLMSQHPIPVVVISSLTSKGSQLAIKSLEAGAVDVIKKNSISIDSFSEQSEVIRNTVLAAAKAFVKRRVGKETHAVEKSKNPLSVTSQKIIAIGASTGGTEAIKEILEAMPIDCPGIVIVQHMPEVFTKSFAERLHAICKIEVKEAQDGDAVIRGRALLAPGNFHMEVFRSGAKYKVKLHQQDPVNRHRPSVDVLFHSLAAQAGENALGSILTGMGADGAKGLLAMREAGSFTIAQDEQSCVVFGMPKEAIKIGAAERIASLQQIPALLLTKMKLQSI